MMLCALVLHDEGGGVIDCRRSFGVGDLVAMSIKRIVSTHAVK